MFKSYVILPSCSGRKTLTESSPSKAQDLLAKSKSEHRKNIRNKIQDWKDIPLGIDEALGLEEMITEIPKNCMFRLELRSTVDGVKEFVGQHPKNEHFQRPDTLVCVHNTKPPHHLSPKECYDITHCVRFAEPHNMLPRILSKIWIQGVEGVDVDTGKKNIVKAPQQRFQEVLGCEGTLVEGDLKNGILKMAKVAQKVQSQTNLNAQIDRAMNGIMKRHIYALFFTIINTYYSDLHFMNEDDYEECIEEYQQVLMNPRDHKKYANIQQYIMEKMYKYILKVLNEPMVRKLFRRIAHYPTSIDGLTDHTMDTASLTFMKSRLEAAKNHALSKVKSLTEVHATVTCTRISDFVDSPALPKEFHEIYGGLTQDDEGKRT